MQAVDVVARQRFRDALIRLLPSRSTEGRARLRPGCAPPEEEGGLVYEAETVSVEVEAVDAADESHATSTDADASNARKRMSFAASGSGRSPCSPHRETIVSTRIGFPIGLVGSSAYRHFGPGRG
jgi:hypothetical protein